MGKVFAITSVVVILAVGCCGACCGAEPSLSTEVAPLEKTRSDHADLVWTATELAIVAVEKYEWMHTHDGWGITSDDPGLLVRFEIPDDAIDRWDNKFTMPLMEAKLAGVYVKDWSLVSFFDNVGFLVAIGEKKIDHETPLKDWPHTQGISDQTLLRWKAIERATTAQPGRCRVEWILPPDSTRQAILLMHWHGSANAPDTMMAKIKAGKVLRAWVYMNTRKADPADKTPR